jgi:hypothetical protein
MATNEEQLSRCYKFIGKCVEWRATIEGRFLASLHGGMFASRVYGSVFRHVVPH